MSRKRQELFPIHQLSAINDSPDLQHPRLSSLRLLLAEKPSPCVTPLHPFQFSKMAGSKNRQDLLSIHMAAPCLSSQVTQERLFNSPVLCLPTLMQLQKEKLQKPYYSKIRMPSCSKAPGSWYTRTRWFSLHRAFGRGSAISHVTAELQQAHCGLSLTPAQFQQCQTGMGSQHCWRRAQLPAPGKAHQPFISQDTSGEDEE